MMTRAWAAPAHGNQKCQVTDSHQPTDSHPKDVKRLTTNAGKRNDSQPAVTCRSLGRHPLHQIQIKAGLHWQRALFPDFLAEHPTDT
jgi:hypothetical protein